jgi:hypothetical protein
LRQKIKCIGNNFVHSTSSTLNKVPKFIEWDFNNTNFIAGEKVFFVDQSIIDAPFNFLKSEIEAYGWLLESRCLNVNVSQWILDNIDICKIFFKSIFTCDKRLLDLDSIFKFLPAYGTYIDEFIDKPKTKLVSMVTSNKNFAPLHPFRNNFAHKNSKYFDLFGRGYHEINKKEEALNDYMFSVAIENDFYNYYYTEKLIDCFATKTVPVYLGSSDIAPFNEKGVIRLTSNFDFSFLNKDLYTLYLPHIEENFELSKQLDCLEDYLFVNHLKD